MPYFIEILRDFFFFFIIQELGMRQRVYKYYGQQTAVGLHKNHWIKSQIDELIVVCIFKELQTKNLKSFFQTFFNKLSVKRLRRLQDMSSRYLNEKLLR